MKEEHCKFCTQCDYWRSKAKAYQRKIKKHMQQLQQSALSTAQFNSATMKSAKPLRKKS